MGRPINKKFFANLNAPYDDAQTGGPTGIGGEGLAGIVLSNTGTNYTEGTTVTFGAPQLPGGTTATGSLTLNAFGNVTALTIDTAGTGYTSTVTFTVTTASSVSVAATGTSATTSIFVEDIDGIFVGMVANGTGIATGAKVETVSQTGEVVLSDANTDDVDTTVVFNDAGSGLAGIVSGLTSSRQNGITVYAYVDGGSSAVIGDIMKQTASRQYLVKTAQGQSECVLATTSTLVAGQMYMTAVDVTGASYFVDKLTARKARLYRYAENGGTFEFANGDVARWSLSAATTGTVQVSNS